MNTLRNQIEQKLQERFGQSSHIEVINESAMHSVPPGSETHFKIIVVSSEFEKLNRLARHRSIQDAIDFEITNLLRAVSLRPYTPGEWKNLEAVENSPSCRGGSK